MFGNQNTTTDKRKPKQKKGDQSSSEMMETSREHSGKI